jgi:hypothetical protein
MPAFGPGQTIVTTDAFVNVDPLPAGTYQFRLEVVDAGGNVSAPSDVTVTVVAPQPIPQPTTPIRVGTVGTIGRLPIQPVVEEVEKVSRIPIFKRPLNF